MTHVTRLELKLAELQAAWERQGAPVARLLAPGAAETAIREAERVTDFALPRELRTWWAWHDGLQAAIERSPSWSPEDWWVGSDFRLLSMKECLGEWGERCQENDEEEEAEFGALWSLHWLPIALRTNGDYIVADCATPEEVAVPILYIALIDAEPVLARLPSLESLIDLWLSQLLTGRWGWDTVAARWRKGAMAPPPEGHFV